MTRERIYIFYIYIYISRKPAGRLGLIEVVGANEVSKGDVGGGGCVVSTFWRGEPRAWCGRATKRGGPLGSEK